MALFAVVGLAMKRFKLLVWCIGLLLLTVGATQGALYLQQQPGGINGLFEEMGAASVFGLFVLPLLLVVFAVFPPLMYPLVVVAYPLMWLWRKLRGNRPGA